MYKNVEYRVKTENLGNAMAAIRLVCPEGPGWLNKWEFTDNPNQRDVFVFRLYVPGKIVDCQRVVLDLYGELVENDGSEVHPDAIR